MLADCTPEAVAFIAARVSDVQELGAGDGRWARALRLAGLFVWAVDPQPGEGVEAGTHEDALPGVAVLIVWPPDALEVADWLPDVSPEWVFTVGDHARFETRGIIRAAYAIDAALDLPAGRKGASALIAWRLRAG